MKPAPLFRPALFVAALSAALAIAACTRHVGDAVVLEKEHIAAAEPSPTATATPSLIRKEEGVNVDRPAASDSPVIEEVSTELAPDEIAVDSYVMKKDARGTG